MGYRGLRDIEDLSRHSREIMVNAEGTQYCFTGGKILEEVGKSRGDVQGSMLQVGED